MKNETSATDNLHKKNGMKRRTPQDRAPKIYNQHLKVDQIIMSLSRSKLENFRIPLEEILKATDNFNKEQIIGDGGYGVVYRGQLSERWQNQTAAIKRVSSENCKQELKGFHRELEMIIRFQHENVNAFIGFCDENDEMIMLYVYAVNRSLDLYLKDPEKMSRITWEQRLKICIETAKGIKYLHSGVGEKTTVIHRNVKSANIVFDENMTAQICGFDLSMQGMRYQPHSHVYTSATGSKFYLDPMYIESGILRTETDVYSFGVVMCELLSGVVVDHERSVGGDNPGPLMHLVRRYDDQLEKLIDPCIRDQINRRSFYMFKELTYKCLSFSFKDRPTMAVIISTLEEALQIQKSCALSTINVVGSYHQNQKPTSSFKVNLENFKIPLNEIKKATENFCSNSKIGGGGFGSVHKGQLSERWENRKTAIKLLRPNSFQGENEFLNELQMFSGFNHENIIPFIGYCDEDNQMIIVSEYAVNGSLDYHLQDPKKRRRLSWVQRLKICIGAARGLNYLHTGLGGDKRVIHRDFKSANVLLNEYLEARICDFGFSRSGFRNQLHTQVYTKAAGTRYYIDPAYMESGILRKESDVYSYGVVLFEMLSGMLAYKSQFEEDQPVVMMNLVRRYSENQIEKLIDPLIRDQIDDRSLHIFQDIACQCVSLSFKERPTMQMIIEKIEESLGYASEHMTEALNNGKAHVKDAGR